MSWFSSAISKVGSVVKKVAAPVVAGALAIPGAGAVVAGAVKLAGSAIGALQGQTSNASKIAAETPGTFVESMVRARANAQDDNAMSTTGAVTAGALSFFQSPAALLALGGVGVLLLTKLLRPDGRARRY